MLKKIFADLHCHPTGKLFNAFSLLKDKKIYEEQAHPWNLRKVASKKVKLAKGKRATKYSQSDFARLTHGKVKLVFAAMYPFEQGFFDKVDLRLVQKMRDSLESTNDYAQDEINYSNFTTLTRVPNSVASIVTGLTAKRIKYIRSNEYDYWNEFLKEYYFIQKKSGIPSSATVYIDSNNNEEVDEKSKQVEGTYFLMSSQIEKKGELRFQPFHKTKLNELIETDDNHTYVVLTIEGMNVLSMHNQAIPVHEDVLMQRIDTLKSLDPPIFFITFAHHFNNNLCGHAHSIPEIPLLGPLNPNQDKNMNVVNAQGDGFTPLGIKAAKRLLGIEKNGDGLWEPNSSTSRRILIDVKHMSASSRRDYYDLIIRPYLKQFPEDPIPVIASHVGYANTHSLQYMIDNYENESNFSESPAGFNNWNINLSDEDIKLITKSKGLIGICFDQRVLGVQSNLILDNSDHNSIQVIAENIKGMADAVIHENLHKYSKTSVSIWHCLSLGTDFDGMVDPPDDYPTATEFPEFIDDLKDHILTHWTDKEDYNIHENNIDEILNLLSYQNALNFLIKHY